MTKEPISIILGLKDNANCHKMSENLDKYILSTGQVNFAMSNSVFTKEAFDAAVRSMCYDVGLVLERIDDSAIGQGAINNWKKRNPRMRIILVMDNNRRGQIKSKTLFDKGYYNGLYLEDFSNGELIKLLNEDRTKEEAFYYYGLESFVEAKPKEKNSQVKPVVNMNNETSGELDEAAAISNSNPYITRTFKSGENNSLEENYSSREDDLKTLIKKAEKEQTDNSLDSSLSDGKNMLVSEEITEEKEPLREELETVTNGETEILKDAGSLSHDDDITTDNQNNNLYEQYVRENTNVQAEHIFTDDNGMVQSDDNVSSEHKKEKASGNLIIKQKGNKKYDATKYLNDEESLTSYIKRVTDRVKPIQTIVRNEAQMTPEEELFDACVRLYSYQEEVVLNTALTTNDRISFENSLADFIEAQPYDAVQKGNVFQLFKDYAYNYGIIAELLEMPDVESVHMLDYNKIRVKRGGERSSTSLAFHDERHYRRFVDNIRLLHQNSYTTNTDTVKIFTDRYFSSEYVMQVTIYDASRNSNGLPEVVIKKYNKKKLSIIDMIGEKLSVISAAVIINAVQNGEGILLCGPAGCGSTTLLNAMLDYIPLNKNGVVLQHKDELVSEVHPELVIQHPVAGNQYNNNKGITLSELAEAALLLDVDYYIIGDVIGDECAYMYNASTYGYIPWTSIKSTSIEDGILSFVDAIVSSVSNLPADTILNTVLKKFRYIVYMEDKKVISIAKVKKGASRADFANIAESLEYLDIS